MSVPLQAQSQALTGDPSSYLYALALPHMQSLEPTLVTPWGIPGVTVEAPAAAIAQCLAFGRGSALTC